MFVSKNRCITGREADRIGYKNDIMMHMKKIGKLEASEAIDRIYINNESQAPYIYPEGLLTFTVIKGHPTSLVNAFDWRDTDEGYEYWSMINTQFLYGEIND